LASLTRRGRALARRTLTLQQGMYVVGTVYNFCTPHESLCVAGGKQTPAMAAGITDHCWTVRELLSFLSRRRDGHPPSNGASLTCAETPHGTVVQRPRLAVELPPNEP